VRQRRKRIFRLSQQISDVLLNERELPLLHHVGVVVTPKIEVLLW